MPSTYLVLATLPSLPVALVAIALGGFAAGPINPLLATVTFEIVPYALRGRVLGVGRAGAWAAIPAGILLGGLAVETFGVAATFLAMGISLLAITVYGFFNPAFREMDARPDDDLRSAE